MARTDDRLFAPFPIEMDEHPKIIAISDAAFRAIFEATFYSRRLLTDGFLDRRVVLKRWGQTVADELSCNDPDRPSWVPVENGWQIHGFEKYHPLKADIDAIRQKRALSGRRGGVRSGESRANEANVKQNGSKTEAEVEQTASETKPETETETETTQKELVRATRSRDLANDFDEWWAVYPKKQGKEAARRRYMKVRGSVEAGPLLDGARAYALLSAGEERRFVKLPAGWLNDGRWADDHTGGAGSPAAASSRVDCHRHEGYPVPCEKCLRDAELPEGADF